MTAANSSAVKTRFRAASASVRCWGLVTVGGLVVERTLHLVGLGAGGFSSPVPGELAASQRAPRHRGDSQRGRRGVAFALLLAVEQVVVTQGLFKWCGRVPEMGRVEVDVVGPRRRRELSTSVKIALRDSPERLGPSPVG